ncbi:MAG: hypothetical protein JWQ30_380 [Sediminibacterium sp.]|nr:hypothetical protein [Sediminibacterium sp.]
MVFLQLATATSFAQAKQANLTGIVTDTLQKALSYATISVYAPMQLTGDPVKRTYTDKNGSFRLLIDTGYYDLTASHTGFLEIKIRVHVIQGDNNIGSIALGPMVKTLQEVTVTSRKNLVEQSDDKIIYNAELDPVAKSGSASDLLRKTPMVTVDGDGNVQLNGQNNFKILLNGRETAMFAQNLKDALKSFPGALITKIEVITSPSAKYDAEGIGGVINIVTRKKLVGYNGYLSNYYSTLSNFSQSVSLNVKTGRLGITSYYGQSGSYNDIPGSSTSVTTALVPAAFTKRSLAGQRKSNNYGGFGNLELSYDIDSFRVVTLYGNLGRTRSHSGIEQSILTDYQALPSSSAAFLQDNRFVNPSSGMGVDFMHKYPGIADKEFSMRFNSQFSHNNGYTNSEQHNPAQNRFISNKSEASNSEYTFQVDLTQPVNKTTRLETGIKTILRSASSDFISLAKYNAADAYIANPANSDKFNYHQEVYSAYASINKTINAYALRLGLRAEHTEIHGDFETSKTKVMQHYTNLVPNVQLSRKISQYYSWVLSYNLRLQRPYITNLNPFVNNNDSLNISFGNPDLGPQTIHMVSLQARYVKTDFFAAIACSASYTGDMIVQYSRLDNPSGIISTTSANAGKEWQYAITANMNATIGKKINMGLNGVIRYNTIQNQLLTAQQRGGVSGNLSGYFNYRVVGKFTVSGSGGFQHAPYSLVNSPGSQFFYQTNLGCKFFQDKLFATMNFNNFLKEYFTMNTSTINTTFHTLNNNTYPYRVIYLGVTYNFGKLKESVSKKKGITNDDLIGQ